MSVTKRFANGTREPEIGKNHLLGTSISIQAEVKRIRKLEVAVDETPSTLAGAVQTSETTEKRGDNRRLDARVRKKLCLC